MSEKQSSATPSYAGGERNSDLLLLCRRAAQQHVEQDVRQQVDGDFVVVFDDEAAALEDLAGQLVSHLGGESHIKTSQKNTFVEIRKGKV